MSETIEAAAEEVLDVEGAAKLLLMSPSWLYQAAQKGAVPAYKVGRKLRFKRSTLLAWLEKQKTHAPAVATLGRG